LEKAAAHARGAASGVIELRPRAVDVTELRRRLGLTQDRFAARSERQILSYW
jgi:DNA-binding transcriptional regulator YiaG